MNPPTVKPPPLRLAQSWVFAGCLLSVLGAYAALRRLGWLDAGDGLLGSSFSNFAGVDFLILAAAFVGWMRAFRQDSGARRMVVLAFSLLFFYRLARPWTALLPLLGFAGLGYGFILLLHLLKRRAAPPGLQKGVLWAAIAAAVLLFVIMKGYIPALTSLQGGIGSAVGLSYLLFRLLHLLVDIYENEIATLPGPRAYFNYLFFFLSYLSGPIQRYQDFEQTLEQPAPLRLADIYTALSRLVAGLLKVYFFGSWLELLLVKVGYNALTPALAAASPWLAAGWFWGSALLYLAYLYLNFSGYMDIILTVARLAGLELPENFNRPFRSGSFIEFWSRWHITLSQWFQVYFFNPLLKLLIRRSGRPAPASVAAYFATFVVLGWWHGSSWMFLVYGLLLGLAVSINKLYQLELARRLGKAGAKKWSTHPAVRLAARSLTVLTFALALACFWLHPTPPGPPIDIPMGILAGGAFWGGLALILWLSDRIEAAWARSGTAGDVVLLALKLALLALILWQRSGAKVEFIYQGF